MDDIDLNGDWDFDPSHTRIGFSARHAMVTTVRGSFNDIEGHFHADLEDMTKSTAVVRLKTGSIDTRNDQRDDHLRSGDFFDAERWPEIVFESTDIEEIEERAYIVNGNLTIRDVTRPTVIPLELMGVQTDPQGNIRAGFEGSRRVNRRDFGLEWNVALDAGGVLVSEKISLEFEISAVKRQDDESQGDESQDGESQDGESQDGESQ
ncbi:MAG: YceI family protein, partial [Intrasporangium sp.]|uniref:YceI family protein n=1 Tax=Intrasporangium sp. TaxID=1925024 RepID=UPI0026481F4B